jgi:transposase
LRSGHRRKRDIRNLRRAGRWQARHAQAKTRCEALDRAIAEIAAEPPFSETVGRLCCLRGVSTLTALALTAELGDWTRFRPQSLGPFLGLTPSEDSSGERRSLGAITKTGNTHARRLLVEAAWHYRHAPRRPATGPAPDDRAWQAQVRLHHRYRHLTQAGKRTTVTNIAIARELVGFLWAAMTDQPLRATDPVDHPQEAAAA